MEIRLNLEQNNMAENSEGASGLSAEAKVFIPRQVSNHGDGHMTIQQIPSYMMNCYPFVQADYVRNRAPWFGNNRGRGYHGNQGNRKQRSFGGFLGNRMPGPHNFPGDFHMPYHPGMPPPPMDMPWNGVLPMNPMMLSNRMDCTTQPNGVPFDGGTKSPDPQGTGGGTGEKHRKQNSGRQDNVKYRKPDTNNNRGAKSAAAWEVDDRREKSRNGQKGRSEVGPKVNAWGDNKDTTRTVICKEITVQTDFPDRIANLTLQQKPSPLFVSKTRYHGNSNLDSSDSDLDSDSGYSSPLHKRNQVSSGTHPAGFIETITFSKSPPLQSESRTVEAAKSVLQPKMSYAMIAQKVPTSSSHNTCVHTENLSSGSTSCDNRSKDKNNKYDPHWSKEGKTGANKNNINSNLHCGANVTNNNAGKSGEEDNDIERENVVGEKKKRKRNRKRKKKKGDGNKVEDNEVVEKEDIELHFEDEEEFPDLLGNKKQSREVTPGSRESNKSVIEDRINLESDENLVMSTPVSYSQNQNNSYSGTPWKTHSGHQNAWNNSGQREITPNVWKNRSVVDDTSVVHVGPVIAPGHQELSPMGIVVESPVVMGTLSYSDILKTKRTVTFQDRKSEEQKTNAQKQLKKAPHKSAAHQNTSGQTDNTDQSETRATRKRRKRREMMNQAAEEELAEISLEQDMLRELNLNPKSKVGKPASKSTATVKESNSPQPGILHANPSQPLGGGGKKSKQLIALDLGAMIDALEKKKDVTDQDHSHHNTQTNVKKKQENQVKGKPHNILDASAPVVKRGKERENPKPKKPSPLKKVILKEREEKKQLRLLEENMPENTGAPVGIGVVSAESDLSQDAMSYKGSADYIAGTPASNDLSPISQTSSISMSPLSPSASPLSSEVNSPVAGQIGREAVLKIHSRRFREYCNQVLNKDIDNSCTALLQDLVRFQDRVYHRDPTKAKIKRRIVLGLREVTKHLKLKKIKCVIISPNLEKIQSKGGLDDALNNILNLCNQQDIPFVFALGRRSLGRACAKLVPVSVVGIFNYEGTETNFKHLMELTEQARQSYKEMVSVIEKEIREYPTRGSAASAPHIYAHMGHSRTPSGASVLSFTSSILSEPISENYPHSEPETDSKGYEIVKDVEENFGQFNFSAGVLPNKTVTYPTKVLYKLPHKRDIDDGNEADTEDFGDMPRVKGQCQHGLESDKDSDDDSQQGTDTVEDLPHIDSIHSSTYDLSTEILSQHSGRTIENCEAMSTHSSRTLGDGSSTILADPGERSSKHDTPKSMESPSSTLQRGKVIDEERIKHWVDETQSRLENLQLQISGTEDSGNSSSESETEENSVDEVEKVTCDPQVKVEAVSTKNVVSVKSENHSDIIGVTVSTSNTKIKTNLNGDDRHECEKSKDDCVNEINGSCEKQNDSNVSLTMTSQGQNNPLQCQTEVKRCEKNCSDVGQET